MSSVAAFEAGIQVKSMYATKSCFKTIKNWKYGNQRIFFT